MKTVSKIMITSTVFASLGFILICIPPAVPAGIGFITLGSVGLMFGPLVATDMEDF